MEESKDVKLKSPKLTRKRSTNIYGGKTVCAGTAPYISKQGNGNILDYAASRGVNLETSDQFRAGKSKGNWKKRLADADASKFFLATGIDAEFTTRVEPIDLSQIHCCALKISAPDARERWYLPAKITTQRGEFLLDGGANSSMIKREFYETLSPRPPIIPSGTDVTVANGGKMRVYGLTTVPFFIDGNSYMMRVLVMEGLTGKGSGILGADFSHIYRTTLEGWTGRLFLMNYQNVAWAKPESAVQGARLAEDVILPPRTAKFCSISVDEEVDYGKNDEVLFVPTWRLAHIQVGSTESVCEVDRPGGPVVCLWNPSSMRMRLSAGTVVGALYECTYVKDTGSDPDEGSGCEPEMLSEDGDRDDGVLYPDPMPQDVKCPLQTLVDESHLTNVAEKGIVLDVLQKNKICFAMPGDSLGRTDRVVHKVNTGDAIPIKQSYRRMPMARQARTEGDLRELLRKGVIEESGSPWGSALVIVGKKDGTERLCVDYRKLNLVTRKDSYPLPRMDECIESLGGNKYFIALDLEAGYWQIAMDEADKEKTAFISSLGLFQFKVMSFGLCNAPATFQRLMDKMLDGLKFKKCLVYIDDIVIFGKTFKETLDNFQEVLTRIESYGLKLKPKKCKIFRTEVEYLGRVVSQTGVKADPNKVKAIQDWPRPKTVKDVRSFLGFASYYREFQPNFAAKVAPLQAIVRDANYNGRCQQKINWSAACERAFVMVKKHLMLPPVLGYPRPDGGKFILDTDASGYAMAGVLSQEQDGKEVVLSYASNSFNDRQRNYCTTKRELLAVVTYLNKFRHFIQYQGDNYIVRTDHASLKWLVHLKGGNAVLQRWLTNIGEFHLRDYHIVHRPGRLHLNADALSRPPTKIRGVCGCPNCRDCGPKIIEVAMMRTRAQARKNKPVIPGDPDEEHAEDSAEDEGFDSQEENEEEEGLLPKYPQAMLEKLQNEDEDLRKLRDLVRKGDPRPSATEILGCSHEMESYLAYFSEYAIANGVLMMRWIHKAGHVFYRALVPPVLREELFEAFHGNRLVGHFGINNVGKRLKQRYYWPGMDNDVRRWVSACQVCACRKDKIGNVKTPLKKELHGRRWSRLSADIIGPFPVSARGNKYVMVVIDHFTKWVEAYAMPDHTAPTCAWKLVTNWFALHGAPFSLQTDGGPEFLSQLFEELASIYDMEKLKTLPYRPQSNGMVERMNRVLLQQLSCMVKDEDISRWMIWFLL